MKSVLYALAGAAVLGGGYLLFKRLNPGNGLEVTPGSNPSGANQLGNQPAQQYPFQPPVSQRVDNSNQPWYGGDRSVLSGPAENYANFASVAQSTASVVHSLSDIWGELDIGSWFSEDGADSLANNDWSWSNFSSDAGNDYGVLDQYGVA